MKSGTKQAASADQRPSRLSKPEQSSKSSGTIFLSYAHEDKARVEKVYQKLKAKGLLPWMDKPPAPFRALGIPPGKSWEIEIRKQLRLADVVLAFLSAKSIAKQGYVQKEYRLALGEMTKKPPGHVYLISVLLERCEPPDMQVDTLNLKGFRVV